MCRWIHVPLFVLVAVGAACHDPDAFTVGPDNADGILSLAASPTSITANGFSRTTITATIDPRTSSANRTITFKTSAGTLYAPGKSGQTVDVPATSEGTAIVQLESTKTTGTARVDATIGAISRAIEVQFVGGIAADIITVDASRTTGPADGATITFVVATIAPDLPQARRTVTFTTNTGSFGPEGSDEKTKSIVADAGNRAVANLRSPQVTGAAQVRAVVDDTSANITVNFVAALPDRIAVAADEPSVRANGADTTVVRTTLLRDIGKVSVGTPVIYRAFDADGILLGTFAQATLSDADGKSTATFRPGDIAYRGLATIQAFVEASVVGTTVIEIID
jgi:hypothetical protein